jgi:L-threonylcarbamoyladenylate synthase
LRVDPSTPDPAVIAEAAGVLRAGGLVAFPTETVYGLGANALDQEAVEAIFAAKERARDDPLIVHIADLADLERVALDVPPLAGRLAAAFWPGPLTLVLRRAAAVAPAVSAGLQTVAVRMPRHPVAVALIRAAGVPIAAPSANRFMRTSATTVEHVLDDLDGRIDMVLDGGPADAGIESTVVALEGDGVRVLRQGAVTVEQLEAALAAEPGARVESVARGERSGSPGMLGRHYAPRKPLTLVTGPGPGTSALARAVEAALADGERPGLLVTDEDAEALAALAGVVAVARLGSADNLAAVARRLYSAMRELDRHPAVTRIFSRTVEEAGLGMAINDRLRRAAELVIEAR